MSQSEFLKYLDSPDFKELLARYENAMEAGESPFFDTDDLIDLAEYYHIGGDVQRAEMVAEYCLDLYPNETSALLFLARIAMIDYEDITRARILYNKVQDKDESVEARLVFAEILMLENKPAEADEYLLEAWNELQKGYDGIEEDEEEDEKEDVNFPLDVAMLWLDHGYADIAEKWLQKTTAQNEGQEFDVLETKARILTEKRLAEQAVEAWNKVLDIDAYNVNAWMQLCDMHFALANFNEALQCTEYVVAISPHLPDAYIAQGNCYYALNKQEKALACLEKYLTLCPEEPAGELLMSTILFCLGRNEEAYECAKKTQNGLALLSEPHQIEALRMTASIASKLGYSDEAIGYCQQLEAMDVPLEDTELIRGTLCLDREEFNEAMGHFINAVENGQGGLQTIIRVCMILYEYGAFLPSYKMLTSLLKLYDKDSYDSCPSETFALMAAVCKQLDKRDEYLKYLDIAVERTPLDVAALLGEFFPVGMEPKDYVDYERSHDSQT